MIDQLRIDSKALTGRVMSADEAAALIQPGANVGMSGFTGAGLPEGGAGGAGPPDHRGDRPRGPVQGRRLDRRLHRARTRRRAGRGRRGRTADALPVRPGQPRQDQRRRRWTTWTCTCRTSRRWSGRASSGTSTLRVVEVAGITADGDLIPSSSVGNNKTWIDQADQVILEVNSWQPMRTGGHARHLLRHSASPEPQADPDHPAGRPHRHALPALPAGEDHRDRARPTARTGTRPSRRPTPTRG